MLDRCAEGINLDLPLRMEEIRGIHRVARSDKSSRPMLVKFATIASRRRVYKAGMGLNHVGTRRLWSTLTARARAREANIQTRVTVQDPKFYFLKLNKIKWQNARNAFMFSVVYCAQINLQRNVAAAHLMFNK